MYRKLFFLATFLILTGCSSNPAIQQPSYMFAGKTYSNMPEALNAAQNFYDQALDGITPLDTPEQKNTLNVIDVSDAQLKNIVKAENYNTNPNENQLEYLSSILRIEWNHYQSSIKKRNVYQTIQPKFSPDYRVFTSGYSDIPPPALRLQYNSTAGLYVTFTNSKYTQSDFKLSKEASSLSSATNLFLLDFESSIAHISSEQQSTSIGKKPIKGEWIISKNIDAISDVETVIFSLRSNTSEDAHLNFRCKGGKVDSYVTFNEFLNTDKIKVTYRIDKLDPITNNWPVSTNYQSAFYPNKSKAFLYKTMTASSLAIRLTPHGENPKTAIFNVSGLANLALDETKACAL